MLTIRLSRIGKKHAPMYRLTISEKAKDPYGRALEILGSYNPTSKELVANADRIQYWISKGAQMSPTVNNLLLAKEIINGEKVKASKAGTKKKALKEAKEAKEAPKVAPKTVVENEEAPAEAPAEAPSGDVPVEEIKEETPEVVAEAPVEEVKEEALAEEGGETKETVEAPIK
ncbi:MAG: 30S ribosomal protein S16 [bacterium]